MDRAESGAARPQRRRRLGHDRRGADARPRDAAVQHAASRRIRLRPVDADRIDRGLLSTARSRIRRRDGARGRSVRARRDARAINEMASTLVGVFGALGLLALGLAAILAWQLDAVVNLTAEQAWSGPILLLLVGLQFAVGLPCDLRRHRQRVSTNVAEQLGRHHGHADRGGGQRSHAPRGRKAGRARRRPDGYPHARLRRVGSTRIVSFRRFACVRDSSGPSGCARRPASAYTP